MVDGKQDGFRTSDTVGESERCRISYAWKAPSGRNGLGSARNAIAEKILFALVMASKSSPLKLLFLELAIA